MEIVFQKLTNVKLPNKAHKTDAGIDFYIPYDLNYIIKNGKSIQIGLVKKETEEGIIEIPAIEIEAGKSILIPMGVKSLFADNYALVFFNRSGIATKKHLLRGACIVDSAYTGEIFVNMNNVSSETQYLVPGEKLIQAMLLPVPEIEIKEGVVERETERGDGGFGSTNSK